VVVLGLCTLAAPAALSGTNCPGEGSCYEANGSPGCDNELCCVFVCTLDFFCCNNTWDNICAETAAQVCGGCGTDVAGSCYLPNGTAGCDNLSCCTDVCALDASCCDLAWDEPCVSLALVLCAECGSPQAGSCYESNGGPGCDDLDCCSVVCADDPFCCAVLWDGFCVEGAFQFCTDCGDDIAGDCCVANGSTGCSDAECCLMVCQIDPSCCETGWDSECAEAADLMCETCSFGACCSSALCFELTPADCMALFDSAYQGDGVTCDEVVCGTGACCLGLACVEYSPDGCAKFGGVFQGIGTTCAAGPCCPGDADGDGDVDSGDLNEVLSGFGCVGPNCQGDADLSGETDSVDLNLVLGNFGCGL
jgi:hypothetical protein